MVNIEDISNFFLLSIMLQWLPKWSFQSISWGKKKKAKHNLEFISPIFKNSPPFSCMQKSILNIVVIKNPSETLMTAISLLSENSSWTTELHIKFRDSWKPHHGPNNAIKTSPGSVMCPWLWTGHWTVSSAASSAAISTASRFQGYGDIA